MCIKNETSNYFAVGVNPNSAVNFLCCTVPYMIYS